MRVAAGGVMMETEVSLGLGRAARLGTAGWSLPAALTVLEVGLMGVAGMLWWRYQAKTGGYMLVVLLIGVCKGSG